jgi:histidinol-phosphate aminotransferase
MLLRSVGGGAAAGLPTLLAGSRHSVEGATTPFTGLGREGLIRLDRNENAYGAAPRAIAAIQAQAQVARYSDAESDELRYHLAQAHGVAPGQVVLGCGSSEILRMAVDALLGAGKGLVLARPTFEWIADCARRVGASVVAVPLKPDFSHDLDAMLGTTNVATRLVYVCNPNNPTGTLTPRRAVTEFVRQLPPATHVLIDEAYYQYVQEAPAHASFMDRPLEDSRVIVVRTFSKIYGLAGLRVGYAVCAPDTARLLRSVQLRDHLNIVGARAALAAFEDEDHVRTCARRNVDDRQEFLNEANARMARVIDSHANFVMLNAGLPADQVVVHFKQHRLLVAGGIPGFDTHIRVSLGTPADMRLFWAVWDLLSITHH